MNSRLTALFAVGCATILSVLAVIADSTPTPYTWAQTYGAGSYDANGQPSDDPFYNSGVDYPVAIAPMPDGGTVVVGQVGFPALTQANGGGAPNDATLLRLAPDGSITWQKELKLSKQADSSGNIKQPLNRIYALQTDAQGNIFMLGGGGNVFNGGQVPYVAKLDPTGLLLWQNRLAGGTATVPNVGQLPVGIGTSTHMCLTKDGGVLIGGSQSKPGIGYSTTTLVKFGPTGLLEMYKVYDTAIQYSGDYPVAQSKDGTRYVMFAPYSAQDGSLGVTAVVTDTNGDIVAQRSFPSTKGPETPRAIIATADGGFAALSWISKGFFGADAMIVRKFNSDLSQETFEKFIGSFAQNAVVQASSFRETADGGLLIGGNSSAYGEGTNGGVYEAMLMKLKTDGTFDFVSLLGGPGNEQYADNITLGCDAIPTVDGGYAFTIATFSYAIDKSARKSDWWIVHTDGNRKVAGFPDLMIDQGFDKFLVTDLTRSPENTGYYTAAGYEVAVVSDINAFFGTVDAGGYTGIDKPIGSFQAATAGGPTPTPDPGPGCSPGFADCSGTGTCVDLRTDSNNCGTCGLNCPSGTTCSNGTCVPLVALSVSGAATSTSDPLHGHFAHVGDKLEYTITFANGGQQPVNNLYVSATVPSYVEAGTNLPKQFAKNQLLLSLGGTYVAAPYPDAKIVWPVGGLGANQFNFVRFSVTSLPASVRTEQSINLPNNYAVYQGPAVPANPVTGFSSGSPNIATHIEGAIKCTLAAQSPKVAPGGQLTYTMNVTNTAAANSVQPHAIAVMVQPAFTNFVNATVTAPSGATFAPATKLLYVAGQSAPQVVMDLGPIKGGKAFSIALKFQAQWADPVEVPKIKTDDYGSSFLPEAGAYQTFKTAFANGRKSAPGGPTDFMNFVTSNQAVATSRQDSGEIAVSLQGSLALQPMLALTKSISNTINANQGNGNGRSTDFVKPGDQITFILTGENTGRTAATDVFIQDGLPDHSQFVSANRLSFIAGTSRTNPSIVRSTQPAVLDNQSGHHIRFENLTLNPGDRVNIEYTVRVDSGAAAPLAGTFINSDASSIGSSNTLHTPAGRYQNGAIEIVGEALVLAEPRARAMVSSPRVSNDISQTADLLTALYNKNLSAYPVTNAADPLSYVPGVQRYYAHYENAGSVAARSVQLSVPLPAHTVFYRAAFVTLPAGISGQLPALPGTVLSNRDVPAGWGINPPAFLSSGGTVTFTFDKLPAATKGDVMVEVIITDDAIQQTGSMIGDLTNVSIQDGAGSSAASAATQTSAAAPDAIPKFGSRARATLTTTPIADATRVPALGMLKTVPARVLPGSTFDVYITIFNKGTYAAETPLVNFTVPQGTTFVSADYGQGKFFNNSNSSAPGSLMSFFMASNNGLSYGIEPVTYLNPHTAASIRITLKATALVGTTIPDSRTDMFARFSGTVVAPPMSIDVVGSLTGLIEPTGPAWWSSIAGAPLNQVLFNGGVVNLIDIGGNNIVAQGAGNIVAQGGGNIVAQGAGNIVAQGAGNLIPIGVTNASTLLANMSKIVAQGAGNILVPQGNAIVAQGGGNIVAAGAGNIVAQGGGNIVAQGGGNIVAQGAGNAVSLPVSGLVGNAAGQIVAQGAGNIVAQGGGNIVAQGAGNIVASGAGNIISGNGSAIMASTPDSASMVRLGSSIISTGGGGIVAQGGGN